MDSATLPVRRRQSGSERRVRCRLAQVRLDDAEHARLLHAAATAGLSVGAYLRAAVLGKPGVRAARRPVVEKMELARLLGELGKIGSNLNQLARAANRGREPAGLEAALVDVAAMRLALMTALGHGDDRQG